MDENPVCNSFDNPRLPSPAFASNELTQLWRPLLITLHLVQLAAYCL